MTNLEGQTFAGYEVLSKLGEGGMGAVYKARQPLLNRLVALKVMSPHLGADPSFVARFVREASAAANLNHPNMVQVYTAGEADGMHFIAMEFVEGESLQKRLHRLGRIEPREAVAIAVYVAQALQYAWNKAHLIHRDIKPDNVFLSNSGEVKVGDLGLAKSVGGETTELTQTGTAMGSPHYISPEQATGSKEVDFRTDIYSLGCTLYHMLTGKTPYSGDSSMAVMMKHVNDPPPAIFKTWPGCPMPMGMLVGKMLAKDRSARPQSYEQLVEDLLAVHEKIKNMESVRAVAVTPTAAQPKSVTPAVQATVAARPSAKPRSSKAVYAAAGAAAVVALIGLLLWSPWKKGEGQSGREQGATLPVETGATSPKPGPPQAEETATAREAAPAPPKFGTLFDGRDASAWQQRDGGPCDWRVEDGALVAGATDLDTREKFQDFQLHIEFACPNDAKQGNSGVYIQGRYELQILESFGKPATDTSCGSIFRLKAPTENASKPPDEWQTFDITFHAARFGAAGAKTANARVSVIHNGRLIHDNVEIPKSSGKGDGESAAPGPIRLQAYNSPVRFRNISINPLVIPAPTAPLPTQPAVAATAPAEADWQNLIPNIDPQRDGSGSEWKIVNGELVCTTPSHWSMCEVPVNYNGGNYDLRIRVTRGEGSTVGMFFPFRKGSTGGDVIFDYRTPRHQDGLKRAGLEKRRGHSLDDPDLTVTRTQWIPKGREVTILLQVRDDYLAAQLDGKEVFRWTADWSQLQQGVGFDKELFKRCDGRPIFGVGIFNCQATYHAIEMREVSDQGPFTRNTSASVLPDPAGLRYGLYLHFDITTFAGYGNRNMLGKAPVSAFAPPKVDVQQWARVAREFGAKAAVLTAKHEAGFCLWPAKGYDYSVAASPYKADIVAAFVAACKAEGIAPGVHYSVPDAHNEGAVKFRGPVSPAYFEIIEKHTAELAGNYPDLRILLFDAPNRFSPAQRDEILGLVRRANPSCLVLLQSIGNPPSGQSHVAMSLDRSWFWNPNEPFESLDKIRAGYERAVAGHQLFLLNVGIDRNGSIPDNSIQTLNSLKSMLNR